MYPSIIIVPNVPLWWSCHYNFDYVILVFHYSNMTQNSHYRYHSIITHKFTDDAAVSDLC